GPFAAGAHERADGRRRGVEHGDAVALYDLPEATPVGVIRRALVHHAGGAEGKRAVDDVAVSGDPADIGRAPVHVVVAQIEDVLAGDVRADQVAGRGVEHALRPPGGTGR